MPNDQSLHDIINELPATFVDRIIQETDVAKLREKLQHHTCYNRRAVINARIEKLTWLAT